MTVGEKIQNLRKNLNMSQEELGQKLFVSKQTISQWENGQTIPTTDNLIRLKEIFNVPIDEILCVAEQRVNLEENIPYEIQEKTKAVNKLDIISFALIISSIIAVVFGICAASALGIDTSFCMSSGIFFAFLPLPIATFLFGLFLKFKGQKYLLPLITGIVVWVLLCVLGCLQFMFPLKYSVYFDCSGGESIDAISVLHNQTAERPSDPKKEGFTFKEWQLEGETYDFTSPITEDTLLTAVYTQNQGVETVSIVLDYQNGKKMSVIEIQKGSVLFEPVTPEREGHKFLGWFALEEKFDFAKKIEENIVLTAKWKKDASHNTNTSTYKKPQSTASSSGKKPQSTVTSSDKKPTGSSQNPSSSKPTNSSSKPSSSNPVSSEMMTSESFFAIHSKYKGNWYLEGYEDVWVGITFNDVSDWGELIVKGYNFSFPYTLQTEKTVVPAYTIYPYKYIRDTIRKDTSNTVFSSEFRLRRAEWENSLEKNKVVLKEDAIFIDGYKFTRTKGTKTMYDDITILNEALGVWYFEDDPSVTLTATIIDYPFPESSDLFALKPKNFNLVTLTVEQDYVRGITFQAAYKSEWEKHGISVKDDVLTITNGNVTRKFYKNIP